MSKGLCFVVDDSRIARKVARRILEALEFSVEEAEHGEESLALCAKQMPLAILLDWNMPVMSGLEFLLALRKMAGGDAPKVIFCTTENELPKILKAMESGADEYIMKPFDQEIVQNKLVQVGLLE